MLADSEKVRAYEGLEVIYEMDVGKKPDYAFELVSWYVGHRNRWTATKSDLGFAENITISDLHDALVSHPERRARAREVDSP